MSKTKRVTIEIYDEDGVLCESIGGPMDFEEVKSNMLDALKNDGITVLIVHGKHEAAAPAKEKSIVRAALEASTPGMKKALEEAVHSAMHNQAPAPKFEPLLQLRWEFDGVKFDAIGKYDDVMDAQAEFLRGIIEE